MTIDIDELIEAVQQARQRIEVLVPNRGFYGDSDTETIYYVDADSLLGQLERMKK